MTRAPGEHPAEALAQQCLRAAEQLAARYDWQLLSVAELADRALHELERPDAPALHPERMVISVYVEALYLACAHLEGDARRERGYSELFIYLNGIARARYPDVADEAAQAGLLATFEALPLCRNPRAFLAFALQRLWTSVRQLRRQQQGEVSLEQALNSSAQPALSLAKVLADPTPEPAQQVLEQEQVQQLEAAASSFLAAHPRAADQFQAFWLKYRYGLNDSEIGALLHKSGPQLQVLRSRAIARLRNDPYWQALVEDEAG